MYIQYIRDCIDPDTKELLGRKDERVHVPQSVGENLIFRKLAQRCPRPNYGTPEWIAERQAADAQRVPMSADADPNVKGVEWGVKDKDLSPFSKVLVVKRVGSATTFYDALPADCPPSIRARFESLTATVSGCNLEKARREQYEQHEKEKLGYFGTLYGRTK